MHSLDRLIEDSARWPDRPLLEKNRGRASHAIAQTSRANRRFRFDRFPGNHEETRRGILALLISRPLAHSFIDDKQDGS